MTQEAYDRISRNRAENGGPQLSRPGGSRNPGKTSRMVEVEKIGKAFSRMERTESYCEKAQRIHRKQGAYRRVGRRSDLPTQGNEIVVATRAPSGKTRPGMVSR